MNDKTYNGWTNYATWRVNLEMFDGLDLREHGMADEDLVSVSDWLKEMAEEAIYSTSPDGLARDYAMAFISHVNFDEIARHMLDDASR